MVYFGLLKMLLLFLSWMGYCSFLKERWQINLYFAPMLVAAAQILILFLAGILNMMVFFTYLIFLLGIALGIRGLLKRGKDFLLDFCTPGYVFFGTALCLLFLALYRKRLGHYDDFSHWGLIVRQMLMNHRFPNFADTISFQRYPPGSAIFIYYFCSLVGNQEWLWLFAQAVLELCYILPIFAFWRQTKGTRGFVLLYMLLAANFLLMYNVQPNGLLVDTLLPLAAAGSTVFFLYYGKQDEKQAQCQYIYIYIYWSIPLCAVLLLIKNSGILFALILSAVVFWQNRRRIGKALFAVLAAPYLVLPLWGQHCDLVYTASAYTKHAMTMENFIQSLWWKSPDSIRSIVKNCIAFSVQGEDLWVCGIFLGLTALLLLLLSPEFLRKCGKLFVLLAGLYVVYQLCLTAMYIFSMPESEALVLSSSKRYRKTILIVLYYAAMCMSIYGISHVSLTRCRSLSGAVISLLLMLGLSSITLKENHTVFHTQEHPLRIQFESFLSANPVPYKASYMLYLPEPTNDIETYFCKYYMLSNNVRRFDHTKIDELDALTEQYHFLLILESDEVITSWVDTHYPEQSGAAVISLKKN